MADSTVENLSDIALASPAGIQTTDLFYIFRPGAPDADYRADGADLQTAVLGATVTVTAAGRALLASGITVDVNDALSGFKAAVNAQTGTTYTLVAGDSGKVIRCTNASAITVTLPNSLAEGFTCEIIQGGAGQVSFSAAGGATINNRSSHTKIAGQYGAARLVVTSNSGGSSAVYNLAGDTGA